MTRREPCSSRRSRSTQMTPTHWRATLIPISIDLLTAGRMPETDYEAKILGQADRAIALAPDNMRAYYAKSSYLFSFAPRGRGGRRRRRRSRDQSKFGPALRERAASPKSSLGRFEQAKSDLQQAMRFSPRDPNIGLWRMQVGSAELEPRAITTRRSTNSTRRSKAVIDPTVPYANLAAAYALEGKMDEAKSALAEARRLNPNLTVKWVIEHSPNLPKAFEGMRKAGLPEE